MNLYGTKDIRFFYLCHELDDGKTVDISCAGVTIR